MKKNSSKLYYQNKLSKFQSGIKKTWTIYKRSSWEDQSKRKQFFKKSKDRRYKNYRKIIIAKNPNDFCVNISLKLVFIPNKSL